MLFNIYMIFAGVWIAFMIGYFTGYMSGMKVGYNAIHADGERHK